MSLPAVRLVLQRHAAAEAGKLSLTAELAAMGVAAGAGSKKAAAALEEKITLLREIASPSEPDPAADSKQLQQSFAGAFAALGIPTSSN